MIPRVPRPNPPRTKVKMMRKRIKDSLRYFCMMTARMYWPMMAEKVPRRRYLSDEVTTMWSNFAGAFDGKEQSPEGK